MCYAVLQIGLMGLVEMEWIDTLGTLESADVDYTDFVEVGQRLVTELQQEVCMYVCYTV